MNKIIKRQGPTDFVIKVFRVYHVIFKMFKMYGIKVKICTIYHTQSPK